MVGVWMMMRMDDGECGCKADVERLVGGIM